MSSTTRQIYRIANLAQLSHCNPEHVYYPVTVEGVISLVKRIAAAGGKIRAIGGGKSPNCIFYTHENLLNFAVLNRIINIDKKNGLVTCEGGVIMENLLDALDKEGLMLRCVPSYIKTTVAGCIATATHSSGKDTWTLSEYVTRLVIIDGTGEKRVFDESDPARLRLAACHLGLLGLVVEVTLKVEQRSVWHLQSSPVPLAVAADAARMQEMAGKHDYYRFWWVPHTTRCFESVGRRLAADPSSASGVDEKTTEEIAQWLRSQGSLVNRAWGVLTGDWLRHGVIQRAMRVACAVPLLQPIINKFYAAVFYRRAEERYGSTKECFTFDCLFKQWANEWAIEASRAPEAFERLQAIIREKGLRVHFPVEFRFSPADKTALSPANGRPTCWIGVVMYKPLGHIAPDTKLYYDAFEELMTEMGARPHWAKYFYWGARQFRESYGKNWDDFLALRKEMDPNDVFVNEWFDHILRDTGRNTTIFSEKKEVANGEKKQ